jgi:uncharacterized cysteine cluster protein YcgN (CxxCxxCC family)
MAKNCNNCTKCCEGYLKANINGISMYPGKPCYLLDIGKGCTDYENRPYMPCKSYKCEWLKDEKIPEQFKPNLTNFIILKKWKNAIPYLSLIQAGDIIKDEDIDSFTIWSKNNNINYYFNINDKEYMYGSDIFLREAKNEG